MSPGAHRTLRSIHKYAGLTACLWLFVLAVSGILLDHHEWRWLNQNSVPASWTSPQIGRLVPGTVMRHVKIVEGVIVGASERGTRRSADGGLNWQPVRFDGYRGQPQVNGIADAGAGGFAQAYLATDDGLWRLAPDGKSAVPFALRGSHMTAISPGRSRDELVGVLDRSRLVAIDLETGSATAIAGGTRMIVPDRQAELYRVVMDIHFGRALLPGQWGIALNDLGGVAMAALSLSGLAYWWATRRGRRRGLSMAAQRATIRWSFRLHAPVIGLLGALPILYLSLSALPMNHIYGFIDWSKGRTISPSMLPPGYRADTLANEIDGVVAWPDRPGTLSIATRHGIMTRPADNSVWREDLAVPAPPGVTGGKLFRVGDTVFAGFGGGNNFARSAGEASWRKLSGPSTAITGASFDGPWIYLKNSKSFYRSSIGAAQLNEVNIAFKTAIAGTPLFLFMADLHSGVLFHEQFKWLNDLFSVLAIVLAASGPVIWLRRKWI